MEIKEEWKVIPNYNKYEASTLGNIRNTKKNVKLVNVLHNDYYSISLYNNDNIRKTERVHKLVAQTFLQNDENKPTVNHKNWNKLDNNVTNLEWATHKEQCEHKRKINEEQQKLISSRGVILTNIITNEELHFSTMVSACEYIYDNNRDLFEDYKDFAHLKPTIKSRMTRTIKKKLTKGIMYSKYKPKYSQIENYDNERWEKIPKELIKGTDNCYISTQGRVKNNLGRITEGSSHGKYIRVPIHSNNYYLHRLLAQIFIPNPENKKEVNHIDNNGKNNKLDNLEWNTPSENSKHRSNIQNNKYCKKVYQYDLNGNLLNTFLSIVNAAKSISKSDDELKRIRSGIGNCCNGRLKTTRGYIFKFTENNNSL